MIEAFSNSVTVSSKSAIPLNTVVVDKNNTAELDGASTIKFNKCGAYKVTCNASAVAGAAGVVSINLERNGIAMPQSVSQFTAADTTSLYTIGFETIVQVPQNNNNCPCTIPTTVVVRNTGVAATFSPVTVLVEKIS